MKIGLVRRGYSGSGGAEAYLKRFAAALAGAGHDCTLFGSPEWPKAEWPFGEKRDVAGRSPGKFADALRALDPRRTCDFLFSLERVHACDCYRAGDGVHAAWLARRARHEPRIESWFRLLRPRHRELLALEKALFRTEGAQAVVANSRLVRDEIIRHFGYPAERIYVVYNGVPSAPDQETLATWREETRRELNLGANEFVVLFLGSGWERKGLDFAIRGMNEARLSNATLLVAGKGNPATCPRSTQTRFLGPTTQPGRLYAAADVFLLPTLYDPFSNACLEALSHGLPVITSADNGFAEIIESGVDGDVLADACDHKAIAVALQKWRDSTGSDDLRARLHAKGAVFTMDANLRATMEVIERAGAA